MARVVQRVSITAIGLGTPDFLFFAAPSDRREGKKQLECQTTWKTGKPATEVEIADSTGIRRGARNPSGEAGAELGPIT